MAVHKVLTEPNPLLHRISEPVRTFDEGLAQLLDDMLETMVAYEGIGLAAPQIGILKRILVMDLGEITPASPSLKSQGPFKIINPEIMWVSKTDVSCQEGCLSIPDHYINVARPDGIRIRYQDQKGAFQELSADGLLAVCLQHEMDHLDGITLLNHEEAQEKNTALRTRLNASENVPS